MECILTDIIICSSSSSSININIINTINIIIDNQNTN